VNTAPPEKRKSAGVYFQDRRPGDANQWMPLKIPVQDVSHLCKLNRHTKPQTSADRKKAALFICAATGMPVRTDQTAETDFFLSTL